MTLCQLDNPAKTCPVCGYRARSLPTFRECRPVPAKRWKPIAIGDIVERGLKAIGVTKERIERLTRTAGNPGGCGCEARKRWLNDVGYKAQYAIRDGYKAVERFYLGEN
jgi:hypothetical protein